MTQTLIRFDTPVIAPEGGRFGAHVCGREREGGQWEAWIEFTNLTTGETLRTQRETTQPNLADAAYWASGLTPVYLEGALERVRSVPRARPPHQTTSDRGPLLDVFAVYEKNPGQLAQELTALRGWHLRQLIRDFGLVDEGRVSLEELSEPQLGALIMERVRDLRA